MSGRRSASSTLPACTTFGNSGVTEQEILEKFPASVFYVAAVTGVGRTRQEPNASAYRKTAGRSFSKHLKLAGPVRQCSPVTGLAE
jgi:hypothetical protein